MLFYFTIIYYYYKKNLYFYLINNYLVQLWYTCVLNLCSICAQISTFFFSFFWLLCCVVLYFFLLLLLFDHTWKKGSVYQQAVWAPARLDTNYQRSYQRLPADGQTQFLEIPLLIMDDEPRWWTERNARSLGFMLALFLTFLFTIRLLSILWW